MPPGGFPQLVPNSRQHWVKPSRAAASHVNPLSGLQHFSFSGNCKNVLPYLPSIFQDASVPRGFFQYSGSHEALVDKTAHLATTPGWSIICLGTLLVCLGEADIGWIFGQHMTSIWKLNLSEAPIPAFKCGSPDKQYGHEAAIFNLFPFSDERQGSYRDKVSPPTRGFSLITFTSHIATCLGTGHPQSTDDKLKALGLESPFLPMLSNKQRWNVTLN